MRKLLLILLCLLIDVTNTVEADLTGIEILSEQYHVWGEWNCWGEQWEYPNSDSYDLLSNSPISGEVSLYEEDFSILATSSANQFSVSAYCGKINLPWVENFVASESEETILLQPATLGTLIASIEVIADNEHMCSIILSDITAGNELFNYSGQWLFDEFSWPVYPTHQYQFYMDAWADAGPSLDTGNGSAGGTINLSLAPVPEPSTLFLLGFGAVMVRRKLKSQS